MPMSLTEIVQQLLDRIENHPIDGKAAITWIVIVAVGCWLWAEFIEYLESRDEKGSQDIRWRARRPREMADWRQAIDSVR